MRAVDLFAGAGGSSLGAELAGLEVIAAVNHWPIAVESHAANHPLARHYCEDAAVLDPTELPAHDVLVASPSCTGHTRARGTDRPHHDTARATAWCVIRVAEAQRPGAIVVENVPDFLRWVLFPAWRAALEALGYVVAVHELDAADAGVPQHRRRAIITAGQRRSLPVRLASQAHTPARAVLDLEGGSWRPWREYAPRSVARIESAQRRRGRDVLVPYYGSPSSHAGVSLDAPIGTLTTRDRYVLVRGEYARVLTVQEQLALSGFPRDYVLHGTRREQIMQVGNAVPPPLAAAVLRQVIAAA